LRHKLGLIFIISMFCWGIINNASALDLEKIKINFLAGNYKGAILEGEKLLAGTKEHALGLDELYYILALSYLKDGNYLRASDIFEIILNEFKDSRYQDEARLGLGDSYLLRNNLKRAEDCYKKLIRLEPNTKLKAQAYYRLSQIGFKEGDTARGKEYLERMKHEFPSNMELKLDKDLCVLFDATPGFYYTVQVGSFSKENNARNLRDRLVKKGYDAYVEEVNLGNKKNYRVKVGKLKLRLEATQLQTKLSAEGYPTKICP